MKLLLGLLVAAHLGGCDDDAALTCTDKGCSNQGPVQVQLVDESGAPVAARGEYRVIGERSESPEPVPFECAALAGDAAPSGANCSNAVVELGSALSIAVFPSVRLELRFELEPGGMTEWAPHYLTYVEHTEPDFNGPGCECTWQEIQAPPAIVPAGARRGAAAPAAE